jgi:hypothetical protein
MLFTERNGTGGKREKYEKVFQMVWNSAWKAAWFDHSYLPWNGTQRQFHTFMKKLNARG